MLRCKNAEHLFDIKDIAVASGLKYAQICDAGLTQVSIYLHVYTVTTKGGNWDGESE